MSLITRFASPSGNISCIFNKRKINLYITFTKMSVLPFVTSQNDVNDTLMLHHLFCFWRDLVRFNVQKVLSPLRKSTYIILENY